MSLPAYGTWRQAAEEFAGLPVYQREFAGRTLWYTPGFLALFPQNAEGGAVHEASERVRRAATGAKQRWERLFCEGYAPLALTLYLHNRCQLRCAYCFTGEKDEGTAAALDLRRVMAAGRNVAQNCRKAGRPMQVILHGGGEPTLNRRQVDAVLDGLEDISRVARTPLSRYIATNGMLSAEKAAWLASRFDLVGLSCDGVSAVHDAQRPTRKGSGSLRSVERTARALREMGRPFHVRMTVTPASLPRFAESVAYICHVLRPLEIHVEPVYAGAHHGQSLFAPDQAAALLEAFREGRRVGASFGIPVETSGARLAEVHGPYCNVLRPVLNLLPDGSATACFKLTGPAAGDRRWLGLPQPDGMTSEQIQTLRSLLRENLEGCMDCFNALHCVRDCPDGCLVERPADGAAFRCVFNRALAEATILETAQRAIALDKRFVRVEGLP